MGFIYGVYYRPWLCLSLRPLSGRYVTNFMTFIPRVHSLDLLLSSGNVISFR